MSYHPKRVLGETFPLSIPVSGVGERQKRLSLLCRGPGFVTRTTSQVLSLGGFGTLLYLLWVRLN